MRVIAGSAKGRRLISREGQDTRPTTDRWKEMLFGTIQFEVPGARFLDLYAGSGAIGIEALSRGADHAVFVDADPQAYRCIMENIRTTGFTDRSEPMRMEVHRAIGELGLSGRKFDIIFMDPPYHHDYERQTLEWIVSADLLAAHGLIIVESAADTPVPADPDGLEIEKIKEHKVTKFTLLRGR